MILFFLISLVFFRDDVFYFKEGKYEKIIEEFKNSILYYDAIIKYAEFLFENKDYGKVLRLIESYEDDLPSHLFKRALKLKKDIYKKINKEKYKKILRKLIVNYPYLLDEKEINLISNMDFYKGKYYFLKEKFENCIPYFEKSENNLKHYYIGYSYFKLKDYEKAISEFEKVLPSERFYYEKAKILKGLCYKYLGKFSESFNEFFNVSYEYEDLREIAMKEARILMLQSAFVPSDLESKINESEKILIDYSLNGSIFLNNYEKFKNEKNIFLLYLLGKFTEDKIFFEKIYKIEPLSLFSIREIGLWYEEDEFNDEIFDEDLFILSYLNLDESFRYYLEKKDDPYILIKTSEKIFEINRYYHSLQIARKVYHILREEKNLVFFPKKLLILLFPLPYKEFIFEKAREKNIDPYLVYAIIRRESEFNEKAISPKGARGLMQILPETFKKIDKYKDFDSDSLFNPYINIDAGIEILSSLLDSIPEIYLAIASYNAGFYRIKEWKETGIIKDELQFFIDCPFEETRKYTFRVLSDYETYKKIYFE